MGEGHVQRNEKMKRLKTRKTEEIRADNLRQGESRLEKGYNKGRQETL